MSQPMHETIVREVETVLREFYGYTEEEIADVWQKQLIPNRLINGKRVADIDGALDYLNRISPKK